jgi:hypothetical protein
LYRFFSAYDDEVVIVEPVNIQVPKRAVPNDYDSISTISEMEIPTFSR